MKKSELKSRLKPVIKECINEILFEQGILSSIISEVVVGLQPIHTQPTIVTTADNPWKHDSMLEEQKMQLEAEKRKRLKEQKRKLLDATGFKTNVFENMKPISQGAPAPEDPSAAAAGSLAGVDPDDSGVDITGIMTVANRDWGKMI